jgi:predicted TPR repeat methyltransferase
MAMSERFDAGRVYAARTPEELAREYDRVADSYDAVLVDEHDWHLPEILAGLAATLLPRTARVLDAACGTGLVGQHLARFGFTSIEGLDLSAGMLRVAADKGVYTALCEAALGAPLPYPDGHFDAVLVAGAFTPGHAPAESLDELTRITRSGGLVLFSLRMDDPPPGFAERIADLERSGRWTRTLEGAEFASLPRAEPHVKNRLYVHRVD